MDIMLPVSLTSAAMFGLLALWLAVRCGRARLKARVGHGDGGDVLLARRMRAQLNFVETAPFVLALIVLIELAGRGGMWLHIVAVAFVVGRILHGIGMDAAKAGLPRQIGTGVTLLTLLGLSIVAVLVGMKVV
ncbi:MAG: MAPEG family protein [Erythrobacter sp.]|nr:MAPEG family protein [Erythrobacter sp.]NCQ63958.1 MAPEG family protein [Alphaproteobacteria bacterium]